MSERMFRTLTFASRFLAPLSVLVCLASGDIVSALVMLLVCLGTTVCWRLGRPAAFEIVFNFTLLIAAWSSVWNLYELWPGWDLVIHFCATAVLVALALMIARPRWLQDASPSVLFRCTLITGAVLCLTWEAMELAGYFLIDDTIEVHPLDTVGDVVAGMLGTTTVAVRHLHTNS